MTLRLAPLLLLLTLVAPAQSLKVESPAPLHEGINQALIDSFVGEHYYFFFAEPGKFHLTFTWGSPGEGFAVGGKPTMLAVFGPVTPGAVMSAKETPGRKDYEGSVTARTRVVIGIAPVDSKLVRQTTPYTLVATGSVAFPSTAGAPDPIVGVYAQKLMTSGEPPLGAVKFLANGTVLTSNGSEGTWKLFDADSGIYTVTIAGKRMTLTLQRGRGLVDTTSKLTVFEMQR